MITLNAASWSDANDSVLHVLRHRRGVTLTVRVRQWMFDTGLSLLEPFTDDQLWEAADVLSGSFAASPGELKDLLEEALS